MNDGIIKGDGTSRKVFANLPATYEEFRMQAASGTLAMDILFNAAGWQQQPDFLNRRNLLQGSTAALLGLPDTAVPDDALRSIGRLSGSLGNEYVWSKSGTVDVPVEGLTHSVEFRPNAVIYFSDLVEYLSDEQKYVLVNPEEYIVPRYPDYHVVASEMRNRLTGRYITSEYSQYTLNVCRMMYVEDTTQDYRTTCQVSEIRKGQETKFFGYVNSPDRNAYPPAEPDSFKYAYLFRIGELSKKASIVTGSYTGTGEVTKTINFSKLPVLLFLYRETINITGNATWVIWATGMTSANTVNQPFNSTNFSVNGNSLTLTGHGSAGVAELAFNGDRATYRYLGMVI